MVLVDEDTWYTDDGNLSLQLCDAYQKDVDQDDEECCACSQAKYKVSKRVNNGRNIGKFPKEIVFVSF